MMKKLLKKLELSSFLAWILACNLATPSFAQYSSCAMNMAGGGAVPGDGQPHCFILNVSGFPNTLPPYGTTGQCCLEAIGVSISSQCSGDLLITATSPAGTTLVLADHRGGNNSDVYSSFGTGGCTGGGTSFSSYGTGSLTGAPPFMTCAPGQGPYFVPDGPSLNGTDVFVGENINGAWTICFTVDNPSACGGVNNSVIVSSIGIFGNSNSLLTATAVIVTASSPLICNGNSTSVTASSTGAVSYTWSPFNGLSSSSGAFVNASPAATTTYTVTATNGNGSTSTSPVIITVNNPPVINSTSYDATCGNNNGIITALPIGNSGPYVYAWNTVPIQYYQSVNGLSPGTYTCTVTDANGCTSTGSTTIINIPGGVAAIPSSINPDCFGASSGAASAIVTGGTPPYNFTWNTLPLQTNPTASNIPAGNYTVVVSDANGCTTSSSITLSQPPSINLVSSIIDTYCSSPTGMCNITASGGSGNYNYQWSSSPVQTSSTAVGLGAGTYICIVTDGTGCSASETIVINYFNSAAAVISAVTPPSCYGKADGSAVASVTGGAPPYSFIWNTVPQQTTATANNLPAGLYMLTVTDAAGCTATATTTLNEPAQFNPVIGIVNTNCTVASGQASINLSGGTPPYNYLWNTTPVTTGSTVYGLGVGNYNCVITDANNCTIFLNAQVNTLTGGIASVLTSHDVLCFGTATGQAVAVMNGGTPPYYYTWNTVPVQTSDQAVNLPSGSYMVIVTDASGCSSSATVSIHEPPVLSATSNSSNNYCGAVTALATVNVSGGTPPYQYSWNTQPVQTTHLATGLASGSYTFTVIDGNGCHLTRNFVIADLATGTISVSIVNPISCDGAQNGSVAVVVNNGSPPFSYQWNTLPVQTTEIAAQLGPGAYQVLITDGNGCTMTAQAAINEPLPFQVTPSSTNDVCSSHDASATVIVSGGTAPYLYNWNTVPAQTNETATGLSIGNYSCLISDAHQCTAMQTIKVSGTVKPAAAFTYSPNVVSLQSPQCSFHDGSVNASEWYWEFNDQGNQAVSFFKNPVHAFSDTGTYCVRLTVRNTDGCADTTEHCIIVSNGFSVFVPTAFSPNHDGINDSFTPKMFGVSSENYALEIFDRWGVIVFKSNSATNGWDGTVNGKINESNNTLYVWRLQIKDLEKGEIHHYKGQLVLIK